ncbi:MAG TPA: TSUP family transporter [Opitutaceae bacterium]|nr:TSUP family transporter [Opitutaceae bacterium]
MHLAPWVYPVLFLTGFVAGLVDAIAGGGGVIALPVLLSLGLPAPLALGTNKFQSSFGSFTAAWHYARRGLVDLRDCRIGIVATLAGASTGAGLVRMIDAQILGRLIPWLLAVIVAYMIFRPDVGDADRPARLRPATFAVLFGLGLGFYDGFFGPGTGSFWTIAYVLVLGYNFPKATGYTKVMNCTSNLAALALFAFAGRVLVAAGLVMAAGQVSGARLGAGLVVAKGARFIRPIFLTMATLTILRLLWVTFVTR